MFPPASSEAAASPPDFMMPVEPARSIHSVATAFAAPLQCARSVLYVLLIAAWVASQPSLAADAEPRVSPRMPPLFDDRTDTITLANGEARDVRYRLFVPQGAVDSKEQKWPLLVWLHGYTQSGDDNRGNLVWLELIFEKLTDPKKFPCFIVATQCPKDHPQWTGNPIDSDPVAILKRVTDHVVNEFAIDRERIYVSGVSSGGSGAWAMMLRHPDFFAAGAPLASGGVQSSDMRRIAHIPIWSFHVRDDLGTPVTGVRNTVARLKAVGGNVYLTETPGHGHDCWTMAFRQFGVMDWLLAQRQGALGPSPDHKKIGVTLELWKQGLLQSGVQYYLLLPAITLLFWQLIRLRKRARLRSAMREAMTSV
jgi:poly(3-hydroxybutyrate) depolymerase